ncbi:MAG: ATP-binding cassette domain-containing protein [Mariprofundaceae bacterium]
MISLQQMMVRYPRGKVALAGISLDIHDGGFYYLIGESGAGKSTLLKAIYGGLRPTSGVMMVQDVDLRSASNRKIRSLRRRIGIVFQDHRLLFSRTVFENVALPLRVQGWKPGRLKARVGKVLAFVGLEDRMWSYPEALSGGEQQRVAIARAMSAKPSIILADEPTGTLDVATACRMLDYLVDLHRQGATVIMATHDMNLLDHHPANVVRLHEGSLLELSTVDRSLKHAAIRPDTFFHE